MRKRTARRFQGAHALGVIWPARWLPLRFIKGAYIAALDVRDQRRLPCRHRVGEDLAFKRASRVPSHGRVQGTDRQAELAQGPVGDLDGGFVAVGVHHEHARQRSHLHGMTLPAGGLDPRIARRSVEVLIGRGRPGIVQAGFALIRMQAYVFAAH